MHMRALPLCVAAHAGRAGSLDFADGVLEGRPARRAAAGPEAHSDAGGSDGARSDAESARSAAADDDAALPFDPVFRTLQLSTGRIALSLVTRSAVESGGTRQALFALPGGLSLLSDSLVRDGAERTLRLAAPSLVVEISQRTGAALRLCCWGFSICHSTPCLLLLRLV
jgi:hypothetical protein